MALHTTQHLQINSDTQTEPQLTGNPNSIKKSTLKAINSKHKRSLCRNFTQKRFCPYGDRCQFAHGLDELKCNKNESNSYKTKECNGYERKGHCLYGVRCNFIHKKRKEEWGELRKGERTLYGLVMKEIERKESSRLLKLLNGLP